MPSNRILKGKDKISNEQKLKPQWGRYPTDFLRVEIILKALEVMAFDKEVSDYRNLWASYSSSMNASYSDDIKIIVPRLLETGHEVLGNKSIKEVLCFRQDQQKKAKGVIDEFSTSKPPFDTTIGIPSTDIRVLFAALRQALEKDPDKYKTSKYGNAVLDHIQEKVIQKGVRGRAGEVVLEGTELQTKLGSYEHATLRSSFVSCARYTSPIPPAPIFKTMR